MKSKDFSTTIILCYFLGVFGVHRFYTGKIVTGIVMVLVSVFTGFLGGIIWAIIDFISLAKGNFQDKEGNPVVMTK